MVQAPQHGQVTGAATRRVGEAITFTCTSGFVVRGHALAFCTHDGVWSHPAPQCESRGKGERVYLKGDGRGSGGQVRGCQFKVFSGPVKHKSPIRRTRVREGTLIQEYEERQLGLRGSASRT